MEEAVQISFGARVGGFIALCCSPVMASTPAGRGEAGFCREGLRMSWPDGGRVAHHFSATSQAGGQADQSHEARHAARPRHRL